LTQITSGRTFNGRLNVVDIATSTEPYCKPGIFY